MKLLDTSLLRTTGSLLEMYSRKTRIYRFFESTSQDVKVRVKFPLNVTCIQKMEFRRANPTKKIIVLGQRHSGKSNIIDTIIADQSPEIATTIDELKTNMVHSQYESKSMIVTEHMTGNIAVNHHTSSPSIIRNYGALIPAYFRTENIEIPWDITVIIDRYYVPNKIMINSFKVRSKNVFIYDFWETSSMDITSWSEMEIDAFIFVVDLSTIEQSFVDENGVKWNKLEYGISVWNTVREPKIIFLTKKDLFVQQLNGTSLELAAICDKFHSRKSDFCIVVGNDEIDIIRGGFRRFETRHLSPLQNFLLNRSTLGEVADLGYIDDSGMAPALQPTALRLNRRLTERKTREEITDLGYLDDSEMAPSLQPIALRLNRILPERRTRGDLVEKGIILENENTANRSEDVVKDDDGASK